LLRETASRWVDDRCYRLGASLAYYAIFSIFPLLLLLVTALGYALGDGSSVRRELLDSLTWVTDSPAVRSLLDDTLSSMQQHRTARGIGAVMGVLALLFGASGVFAELDTSLNTIWRVRDPETSTFWQSALGFVKDKALSFALVLAAGAFSLGSLVVSAALSTIGPAAQSHLPRVAGLSSIVELASILFLSAVLAVVFRALPRTRVAWGDVLGGAVLAASLLTLSRWPLSFYLAHVGSYAAYGAVGAMLGLMLLIYLWSLVLFFGAEFTRVYAERCGSLAKAS
jgi:membrane protein